MNKVLITGGSGFIGTNLVNYLVSKNYNVLTKRITLVPLTKLWIAYKYWLR